MLERIGAVASLMVWIITGGIAGYIASLLLRVERRGCIIHVLLGVAGALVGSFVLRWVPGIQHLFGQGALAGVLNQIVHAVVGAVLLLIVYELVVPGQQLFVDRDKK